MPDHQDKMAAQAVAVQHLIIQAVALVRQDLQDKDIMAVLVKAPQAAAELLVVVVVAQALKVKMLKVNSNLELAE
jgi:hypothetical protein